MKSPATASIKAVKIALRNVPFWKELFWLLSALLMRTWQFKFKILRNRTQHIHRKTIRFQDMYVRFSKKIGNFKFFIDICISRMSLSKFKSLWRSFGCIFNTKHPALCTFCLLYERILFILQGIEYSILIANPHMSFNFLLSNLWSFSGRKFVMKL